MNYKYYHYFYYKNIMKTKKALEVIRKLKEIMPIARANMLLRLYCSTKGFFLK
jgi:hypothetical protein